MYFLEHEMAILALAGHSVSMFKKLYRAFDRLALGIENGNLAGTGKLYQIAFLKIDEAVGDRQQRQRIRAQKSLVNPQPYHQRAALAGTHNDIWFCGMHRRQR